MTTLSTLNLTCPVCDAEFSSHRIASTHSIGQDTDFRPHTGGVDPQPHYVHVCPACYFAAFEGDFESADEHIRDFVLSHDHQPEEVLTAGDLTGLCGSTKYLLAARCYAEDERAGCLRLADLYLRASWCARQEGLMQREHETQIESIMLFEEALEAEEIAEEQERVILYLLGELYRRVGRHELAIAMFEKAAAAPIGEPDPRFDRLIERQRVAAEHHRTDNMEIDSV